MSSGRDGERSPERVTLAARLRSILAAVTANPTRGEDPMTRIVLTFGLIAGAILSGMMLATMPFMDRIGFDRGEVIGYTTMVLAFLLIYFGVRTYRDTIGGGAVSFGRALRVGLLITAVASACYVATWQVMYYGFMPDFGERYAAHVLEKERAAGAGEVELARRAEQMARYRELYRNPLLNIGFTLLEVFPVGAIVSAVTAGILRRRGEGAISPAATARGTAAR
jgi:hypothetical protein